MFDERKPPEPKLIPTQVGTYSIIGHIKTRKIRKIVDYSAYKTTRPEKVEEIKAVWNSPNLKNNNARITYLLHHCKSVEYGYTLREFAWAIHPKKMSSGLEFEAFKLLHQMFRRYRKSKSRKEVLLAPMLAKLKGDTVHRYYHYNIIDDDEAIEETLRRNDLILKGLKKSKAKLDDMADWSDEDWKIVENEREKRLHELRDHVDNIKKMEELEIIEQVKQKQEEIERHARENEKLF